MDRDKEIQYVPITIRLNGVTLWGLFAPKGYWSPSCEITTYPPHGSELPAIGTKPVNLRLNGNMLRPGIIATPSFFSDVEYLKETEKITRILQTDGWLSIANKFYALVC